MRYKIVLCYTFAGLVFYFMIFMRSFEMALIGLITFVIMGIFFEGVNWIMDKAQKRRKVK